MFFEHQTECLRKHSDTRKDLDREHQNTITNIYITRFHKSAINLNGPQELVNTVGSKI